jgi:hypothetical protein
MCRNDCLVGIAEEGQDEVEVTRIVRRRERHSQKCIH